MTKQQKPPIEILTYEYNTLKYNLKVAQLQLEKAELAVDEANLKVEETNLIIHKTMLEIANFEAEFPDELKIIEEINKTKEA